jgi:probable rRNA maturation factor
MTRRISIRQAVRPAPLSGTALRALVRRAAVLLGFPEMDLRILVVGDAAMERWNRRFLGRPRTTTVISFPEDAPGGGPPGKLAGDILISAPACLRQTEGLPGGPEERVFFYVIHGMLHIMGYDHAQGGPAARRMRRRERRLYEAVLRRGRPA